MPEVYLLDTSTVSISFQPNDLRYAAIQRHFSLKDGYIQIPALAAGEIEFGLAAAPRPLSQQSIKSHSAIRVLLSQFGDLVPFDGNTVRPYSAIRAELWRGTANPKGRGGYKEKEPEDLIDRVSGLTMGIDEKDLMIAAIAVQYDYILATVDRNHGMLAIEAAAAAAGIVDSDIVLRVEDWGVA